jgi:peptidoglycan/LPS O-acetylase OafA/YrhL
LNGPFDRRVLSGGFVGVDIFFVISGFLITSVLLNDIEHGHSWITRFYQRRIARIAPAFFVVLATTLGVGAFIYSAQDFASLGANTLAAALSSINIKLLFQGSYFQISADAQPILHYWSLSVEEQFYLLFPLYLYLMLRFARRPLSITLAVLALSFAASVVMTPLRPAFAFYLLPTRAWELLAGSGLALFRRNGGNMASGPASIAVWGGLGLLALSVLLINESGNFPGWIAAFPVSGTVLILASIENARGYLIRVLLAHPLPVFIGKRSYSLYLWHWPIFSDYHFFSLDSLFRATLKILICIAATLLTYRSVEQPMRTYLNDPQHRSLAFGGFALAVVAVCVVGMEIRSSNYLSADPQQIAVGGITIKTSGRGTVALIGDSQGAMYGHELASLARSQGFDLNVLSSAATNELPNEPDTYWPEVKQFLGERRPDVVILAEAWSSKLGNDVRDLREALSSIETIAGQVILIAQPPILPQDGSREAIRAGVRPPFFEGPADRENRVRASTAIRLLANDRISVLDVAETFLGDGGAIKLIAEDGRFTYHDSIHLSDSGTALVRPMLERALIKALHAH